MAARVATEPVVVSARAFDLRQFDLADLLEKAWGHGCVSRNESSCVQGPPLVDRALCECEAVHNTVGATANVDCSCRIQQHDVPIRVRWFRAR